MSLLERFIASTVALVLTAPATGRAGVSVGAGVGRAHGSRGEPFGDGSSLTALAQFDARVRGTWSILAGAQAVRQVSESNALNEQVHDLELRAWPLYAGVTFHIGGGNASSAGVGLELAPALVPFQVAVLGRSASYQSLGLVAGVFVRGHITNRLNMEARIRGVASSSYEDSEHLLSISDTRAHGLRQITFLACVRFGRP
jgi:hypothetical protein